MRGDAIDLFEFIAGMISVILALVVAQLFLGLANLVQTRAKVRPSAAQGAWVLSLFLFTFQHWWSMWDFRALEWNFPRVLFSFLAPSLLFFAATLVSPRDTGERPVDLGEHFLHVRRPLMGILLVAMIFMTLDGPLFGTEALFNRLRIQQLVVVGAIAAVFFSRSERVHLAASLIVLVAISMGMFIRFLPGVIS